VRKENETWKSKLSKLLLFAVYLNRLRISASPSNGSTGSRQKEFSVKEAYRHLGIVTTQTDVTLKLQVSKEREMVW